MWIIIVDNREFGNRCEEIFIPENEEGQPLTFDSFEEAEGWFTSESDLSDTCSAKYVNMDE